MNQDTYKRDVMWMEGHYVIAAAAATPERQATAAVSVLRFGDAKNMWEHTRLFTRNADELRALATALADAADWMEGQGNG